MPKKETWSDNRGYYNAYSNQDKSETSAKSTQNDNRRPTEHNKPQTKKNNAANKVDYYFLAKVVAQAELSVIEEYSLRPPQYSL